MSANGVSSLLNERLHNWRRGDRVKFFDRFGHPQQGTYVMASSDPSYIVLNMGGKHGQPNVVHIKNVIQKLV